MNYLEWVGLISLIWLALSGVIAAGILGLGIYISYQGDFLDQRCIS